MRTFHKIKQHSFSPSVNIDKVSEIIEKQISSYSQEEINQFGNKYQAMKMCLEREKPLFLNRNNDSWNGKIKGKVIITMKEKDVPKEIFSYKIQKNKNENYINFVNLEKAGFKKVLGKGKISKPVIIRATSFSRNAKRKILKSGGALEMLS